LPPYHQQTLYIGDELFRELCNFRVQVIPDVMHDAFGLLDFCRECVEGVCFESISGLKSVHVDMSIVLRIEAMNTFNS
jgi:hypothetical protein